MISYLKSWYLMCLQLVPDKLVAHCFAANSHDHRLLFQLVLSSHAASAFSPSGIAPKLNRQFRIQLSTVCRRERQSGKVVN